MIDPGFEIRTDTKNLDFKFSPKSFGPKTKKEGLVRCGLVY